MAGAEQLLSQRREIVNFTIEDYPNRLILVGHRLPSGGRKVNDAQTTMAQRDWRTGMGKDSCIAVVWSAMKNQVRHLTDQVLIRFSQDSRNAAHA